MRLIWRFVNRLAWRYDPAGAVRAPWEARGILWRLADGLHRLAFQGRAPITRRRGRR